MLPFDRQGTVHKQGGEELAEIDLAIWPAALSTTNVGEAYDHTGEAPADAAEHLVRKANREIRVDGRRFKIVEAHLHGYMPHVGLRLREIRNG